MDKEQDKEELAKQYFKEGYNCAQSVILAFSDELQLDKDTILKLTAPFGGGMGRLREVCGAFSALVMVEGLKNGYTLPSEIEKKRENYELVQKLSEMFKEENGSIICKEILGLKGKDSPIPSKRTPEYYKSRSCLDCVGYSAKLIQEKIIKK